MIMSNGAPLAVPPLLMIMGGGRRDGAGPADRF